MDAMTGWVTAGSIVLSSVSTLDILFFKRRPASAVLWLAVVWSVPWWGPLVYAVFGIDTLRWPGGSLRRRAAPPLGDVLELPGGPGELAQGAVDALAVPEDSPGAHVLRVTEPAVEPFRVSGGNRATLLVDGDAFYPALLEAVEAAEDSVHLQSYIISPDESAREILEALERQARRGITVRILYDRFGSTLAHFSGFFRRYRAGGVEARPHRTWGQVNLRNHRKVAIVDGRTAFAGGLNLDDRNVSARTGGAPDRDYHVMLSGPIVRDIQLQFLEDWSRAALVPLARLVRPELFPPLSAAGTGLAQVIPGMPDPEGTDLAKAYFGAIASATESVSIVTPYFLPDEAIFEALRFAALRGVDVRVVLPERSNHWYTAYAARALYAPLLRAGVRIFERRPPFIHAKAMVVDGVYAMLGSANLDFRSLHLGFELNVEIVDGPFVASMVGQIDEEIALSREVSLETHERRSLGTRLTENLCRLFQPVL